MSARDMRQLLRLLEIRRYQEAAKRQEYGLAVHQERVAVERKERGQAVLDRAQQAHRQRVQAGALSLADLKRINQRLSFGERQLNTLGQQLAEEREQLDVAQQEYHQARRRSKSLERLEQRRADLEAQELRRQEQKSADEVALRRFMESVAHKRARTESELKENPDE